LFLRKPIKKTVIVYPLGHYKSIEKLEKDMVNVVGADLFDFKKTKEIDLFKFLDDANCLRKYL